MSESLRRCALAACIGVAAGALVSRSAMAASGHAGTLIAAVISTDLPQLDSMATASTGWEGTRFVGNSLYDGLVRFDLRQGDRPPQIVPGLAESWEVNETATKYTFHLRKNVTFHDGTPFNADAVVFNLDRYLKKDSPYYSTLLVGFSSSKLGLVDSYRKIDDYTVVLDMKAPAASLLGDLIVVFFASPTAVQKYGNDEYKQHPVGTGPFKFERLVPRQELDLVANESYWRGAPKLKKLVVRPIADETARVSALQANQVDWIEGAPPDSIPDLTGAGFRVLMVPHNSVWVWRLDTRMKPWDEVRVRAAINFAIDRKGITEQLLNNAAAPLFQVAPESSIAYSQVNNYYKYDPDKARALIKEANLPGDLVVPIIYPTSGGESMQPGPMNQKIADDLAKVGLKIRLQPVDYATLMSSIRAAEIPQKASAMALALPLEFENDLSTWLGCQAPYNMNQFCNAEADKVLAAARAEPDPAKRAVHYHKAVEILTRDAPWLMVASPFAPRALSPNVRNFTNPRSYFIDLTTVEVD